MLGICRYITLVVNMVATVDPSAAYAPKCGFSQLSKVGRQGEWS